MPQSQADLKTLLDRKVDQYNSPDFIALDPVSIPHRYSRKVDIEIAGFFAATIAWGQRPTIIRNCLRLMELMDDSPHQFIVGHKERDLVRFDGFCHRTFNNTDVLYFIRFLKWFYRRHDSLEKAFAAHPNIRSVEQALTDFHDLFLAWKIFRCAHASMSQHQQKSACKRLNMFLRWMVRSDNKGVDFGIWKELSPSQLICPCDVHVERVARKLKLIRRKQTDWQTALELTEGLKKFNAEDPVRYDFALFGLGLEGF